jgi:hypothetical protein
MSCHKSSALLDAGTLTHCAAARRSYLFDQPERFEKAASAGSEVVITDLKDAMIERSLCLLARAGKT